MHVATVAATICKGLNNYGHELDEEMAFAIGLGHDIGHAPFGHAGEKSLNKLLGNNDGFLHEVNGLRVVDLLASQGEGLNLTYATRDGIVCHNGEEFEQSLQPRNNVIDLSTIKDHSQKPITYEGCIVRIADKIAYLGRDIEDALLANIITEDDVPELIRNENENINAHLINKLILDVVEYLKESDIIGLSDEKYELLMEMKKFNYKKIYEAEDLINYISYCSKIIESLFEYLSALYSRNGDDIDRYKNGSLNLDVMFGKYIQKMMPVYKKQNVIPNIIVIDYISGMTDKYALECMKQITIPKPISFDPKRTIN